MYMLVAKVKFAYYKDSFNPRLMLSDNHRAQKDLNFSLPLGQISRQFFLLALGRS